MKSFLHELKNISFISILVIFFGYFLLVVVNLIPTEKIERNVLNSAEIMLEQGNAPVIGGVTVENFSDADAIGITFNKDDDRPFYYAMYAYNHSLDKKARVRGVYSLHAATVAHRSSLGIYEHSQEWHGYQLWLRPLLVFVDIEKIRPIFFFFVNLTAFLLCLRLNKYFNSYLAFLPFFISFLLFDYSFVSLSFLLGTDILIALVGSYFVLKYYKLSQGQLLYRIFGIIGMVASYFSMCNMPMLTVGFPLVTWLAAENRQSSAGLKYKIASIIAFSFCWLLGYSILTFSKLYLAKFLVGAKSGVYALKWYTGCIHGYTLLDKFKMSNELLTSITHGQYILAFIIFVLILSFVVVLLKKKSVKNYFTNAIPYLFVSIYPYIWCVVMPVTINIWWTYLLYGISLYACLQFVWNVLYSTLSFKLIIK